MFVFDGVLTSRWRLGIFDSGPGLVLSLCLLLLRTYCTYFVSGTITMKLDKRIGE